MQALIENKQPIIRSDGTFVRDYVYVLDVVDAYLTLAENLHREEIQGEAFNFGTEQKFSVLELVNKMIKISGKTQKPKILGTAKGEIKKQYLSSKKANKLLNWKSSYSIEKGLKETYDWYVNYFEG